MEPALASTGDDLLSLPLGKDRCASASCLFPMLSKWKLILIHLLAGGWGGGGTGQSRLRCYKRTNDFSIGKLISFIQIMNWDNLRASKETLVWLLQQFKQISNRLDLSVKISCYRDVGQGCRMHLQLHYEGEMVKSEQICTRLNYKCFDILFVAMQASAPAPALAGSL